MIRCTISNDKSDKFDNQLYSPSQTVDVGDARQIIDVVHVIEGIECIHAGIVHIHAGVYVHAADII